MTIRPLGSGEAMRVVAEREMRERARTKAFRWGTVIMIVLVAGLGVVPRLLPDAEDPEWTVAVVGESPVGLGDATEAVTAVEPATITLEPAEGSPEDLAARDDIDGVLVDGRELVTEAPAPERLRILLATAVAQARLAEELGGIGLSEAEAAELLSVEPLAARALEVDDRVEREGVAFLGSLVLFIAIATYGNWVLYSVLEEKANRVVEIVIATISPSQLLAGKVIGVGLLALGQLLVVLAVGVAAAAAAGTLPGLPDFVPASIGWALFWFVLGFVFYATGYAAAGSLTARQEDAQGAATPMLVAVMGAYFASVFLVGPNPDGPVAQVLSFIPPFTPIVMPARVAAGVVATWEIVLATVVMAIAIWAMTLLAARIYRNALLRGGRLKALDALRHG